MAKPNYSYEKRQRELAKKRKKEDKAARRATGKVEDGEPGAEESTDEGAAAEPTAPAADAAPQA